MIVQWGSCLSNAFFVTNGVRQGGILSPMLFNIYIDGLSDILNKSTIGGSIGDNRINHMLYADDLCIVNLSSAGLRQLLVQCDDYCKKHSIAFNVSKSVCMFFKSEVNKKCDNTDMFLSGKAIDFVQETKYLGVILNSQLKTSVDVSRQTRNSRHKPICYYETLDIVPMMSSVYCLDHIAPTCTAFLYGSTPHLVV